MGVLNVGIIGGGQLGSLLCEAAKKIGINAVVYSDDIDSPAKFFTKEFIHGNYADEEKISNFCKIIVFPRTGYLKQVFNSKAYGYLGKEKIQFIKSKRINISSSKLRKNY